MENNNSNIHIYVEHILKVMNENNLKIVVDESPRRSSGLWYKVSVSLLGQYNFNTAHKIQMLYKRNSNGIRQLIETNININKNEEIFENKIDISFTITEWRELISFISSSNGRKKFRKPFHNKLNIKIQREGIKCYLLCKSNWFRKNQAWSGTYKCIDEFCKIVYKAYLSNENVLDNKVIITIKWNGTAEHEKIKGDLNRCCGEARKTLGFEILSEGMYNVQSKNNINYSQTSNKCKFIF